MRTTYYGKRNLENKERALAHIEKIEWVKPIEGADNIELIGVLGWICVAKKGEFQPGDLAVYIEIDSKCPENDERFAFLESKKYKVKTMKLGKFNVISQGLALPAILFPEVTDDPIGTDVTENYILHIILRMILQENLIKSIQILNTNLWQLAIKISQRKNGSDG